MWVFFLLEFHRCLLTVQIVISHFKCILMARYSKERQCFESALAAPELRSLFQLVLAFLTRDKWAKAARGIFLMS